MRKIISKHRDMQYVLPLKPRFIYKKKKNVDLEITPTVRNKITNNIQAHLRGVIR